MSEYKITGYKPEKLFHFFEDISAVPRGTGNEKKISDYLVKFAEERGLWVYQDKEYNVIIKKEGSTGSENMPPVILQGHMDMVCEKLAGKEHDFEKEGINLIVRDGKLFADGTTLGADDGAALAVMMAVLDDNTLKHPPLECVITTGEEAGMTGAENLDMSLLDARTMINMDSEEEGIGTVSSAAGQLIIFKKKVVREKTEGTVLHISISGLLGGHSGSDIDLERQNASLLMARIINRILRTYGGKIVSFAGGTKDNAIPRECDAALIYENAEDAGQAAALIQKTARCIADEIKDNDPGFRYIVTMEEGKNKDAISSEDSKAFADILRLMPDGVYQRNIKADRFVVASSNTGIVCTDEDTITIVSYPRSSMDSCMENIREKFTVLAEVTGFDISFGRQSAGWRYQEKSAIREVFRTEYRKLFGSEMQFAPLHAGLECGIFIEKIPEMDAVAIGPQLYNVHTPDESMPLDSMERFYKLIITVLEQLSGQA